MSDPRYPIGKFSYSHPPTDSERHDLIADIEQLPANLRSAVADLTPAQLDTPYRDGGWTVRQVVHHVPESHMNAYIRFKLALTEDEPTIKPYEENLWSELPDVKVVPIEVSLALLDALHVRFVEVLRGITPKEWKRTFRHPDQGIVSLEKNLALYSWHGRHHTAHVIELRKRMGW